METTVLALLLGCLLVVSLRSLTLARVKKDNTLDYSESSTCKVGLLGGGMVFALMFGVTLLMFGLAHVSSLFMA